MPQADPAALELFENFQDYLALQHLYQAALKQLQIKFEVLNDEFQVRSGRSPIHHIESRLKSTASIIAKLQNRNYAVTLDSAKQNINDIAGIRVVCSYIDDVYAVAEMLLRQSDVRLVQTQDYIQHPNFNGYRSLHLDIQIPIYLSDHTEHVNVEVQLRTVAMDFWASLEHKIHYKFEGDAPENIKNELVECARMVSDLDARMLSLNEEILAISKKREEEKQLNSGTSK